MPKRTNDFQRLIGVIQKHLDPGSTVDEPAMLEDVQTGARREVDIVVKGRVAGQPVTVSMECRDRRRKADVTWVDEVQTKHSRLPTNVLVLASHKPFTRGALAAARLYGTRCVVLNDVDPAAPERLFPDERSLWGKGWQVEIVRVRISTAAQGDEPAQAFQAVPSTSLYLEDGSEWASAAEFANVLIHRSPQVNDHMANHAQPDHTFLEVVWERPALTTGQRVCVQKLEPLIIRPIEEVRIVAKCVVTVDEFPLRHGAFDRLRVAWGKGAILGKPALLVATAADGEQPRLTLRFSVDEP